MKFKTRVVSKYTIVIAKDDLKLELEALADKMTDHQYAIFTKTKELKYDKEFTDGEDEILGLVGYPQADLYKQDMLATVKKAKFAHLITLVKAKYVPYDLDIDEDKARKFHNKWRYVPSHLSAARKKEFLNQKFEWDWPRMGNSKSLSTWIRVLIENERPEDKTKKILAMGFNALELHGKRVILLDPKAYKVDTTYRLELPKKARLDKTLTPEEKQLLEEYAPDLGDPTSFRTSMPLDKIEASIDKMSDDDLAWHLLNSKSAMELGESKAVRNRFGYKEICILELMNKKLSKEAKTSVANYLLDDGGVSFVAGPSLIKYIHALAKTGVVDDNVLESAEETKIINSIYYGKITDPEELRKFDVKKYDYQLANNRHTPADVLEKIVAYHKKINDAEYNPAEVKWSGSNPNMGGVAGVDFQYNFADALAHRNYPLDKLIEVFNKYKEKFKKTPKAILYLAATLLNRPDLPKELAHELVKFEDKYGKKSSNYPPACFDEKEVEEYLKSHPKKEGYGHGFINHPSLPTKVLREILDDPESTDREEAYKKLRERGDLSDKEVLAKVKKELKFDAPDELLKQFGLQAYLGTKGKNKLALIKVKPEELKKLQAEMKAATTHDDFIFTVVDAYKLDQQIHKDYPKMAKEIGNVKHGLYHGTSMSNAAGILATGINTKGESRTGAMFGNGFYLAASASKAAQYASDNFSKQGYGVVFKLDAALGKSAEWKYGRPEHDSIMYAPADVKEKLRKYAKKEGFKDTYNVPRWHLTHDSVQAKKGLSLQHDEVVVKTGQQINITEVIIVHKESVDG